MPNGDGTGPAQPGRKMRKGGRCCDGNGAGTGVQKGNGRAGQSGRRGNRGDGAQKETPQKNEPEGETKQNV